MNDMKSQKYFEVGININLHDNLRKNTFIAHKLDSFLYGIYKYIPGCCTTSNHNIAGCPF